MSSDRRTTSTRVELYTNTEGGTSLMVGGVDLAPHTIRAQLSIEAHHAVLYLELDVDPTVDVTVDTVERVGT